MGREIITNSDVQVATAKHGFAKPDGVPDPDPLDADKYRERLYKYIPSEVISLYMGTTLVLQTAGSQAPAGFGWVLFAIGLLGTWLYLRFAQGVTKPAQLAVSIGAFAVWAFSLGGPFLSLSWYHAFYAALLLPIYTFAAALIEP